MAKILKRDPFDSTNAAPGSEDEPVVEAPAVETRAGIEARPPLRKALTTAQSRKVRLSVDLDEQTHRKLRLMALDRRVPASEIARQLIRQAVHHVDPE